MLKKAKHPLIIVGQGALARADGAAVLGRRRSSPRRRRRSADWNGFAVLHNAAARVGGLDLGFVPGEGGKDVAGMAGRDWTCCSCSAPTRSTWARPAAPSSSISARMAIAGAHRADVILPGAAYTEKSGTYVNTEGRVQQTNRAGFAPGDAREDWAILRALSDVLGQEAAVRFAARSCAPSSMANTRIWPRIDQVAAGDAEDIAKRWRSSAGG